MEITLTERQLKQIKEEAQFLFKTKGQPFKGSDTTFLVSCVIEAFKRFCVANNLEVTNDGKIQTSKT